MPSALPLAYSTVLRNGDFYFLGLCSCAVKDLPGKEEAFRSERQVLPRPCFISRA